jgi:thioredoxin-dependent peroxiredoxin
MPQKGELVPDFELPNQDGKLVRLSDLRGQNVVLFAYPKANSMGCTMQACSFRDALPKFDGINAVILGISGDTPAEQKKFKDQQKLPYDLLSDVDHRVLDEWDSWGRKLFGIFNTDTAVRSLWVIGEDGRVLDVRINVGVLESVKLALQAIQNASTQV